MVGAAGAGGHLVSADVMDYQTWNDSQEARLWSSLNIHLHLEKVSLMEGTGSVLHCWQILIITSA